jgi:Ion channel
VALITLLYFFANFFLVFRYKIVKDYDRSDDNITKNADESSSDATSQIKDVYTTMVYFAVTTINTVGYGDVIPVNIYEYLIALGFLLSGVFLYGFIMNEIQSWARSDLNVVLMRKEMIESFETWLVTLEKKKLQLSETEVDDSTQGNRKLMRSKIIKHTQKAYNLNLRHDRVSVFCNPFFSHLSWSTGSELIEAYLARFQEEYPGIYKLLEGSMDHQFVTNMQIRV